MQRQLPSRGRIPGRFLRLSTCICVGLSLLAVASPVWADVIPPPGPGPSRLCGATGGALLTLILVGTGFLMLHSHGRRRK